MGMLRSTNIEYYARNPKTEWMFSSWPLEYSGLTFPAIVSPGSVYKTDAASQSSLAVKAHLDTGASVTSIDINLASSMGLVPVGATQLRTAGGVVEFSNFIINLQFPTATLAPRINLPICSCDMGFDPSKPPGDPRNFGVLIGRDVISRWNIVWNGPTSTVIIND
jgi:hypothetical protein